MWRFVEGTLRVMRKLPLAKLGYETCAVAGRADTEGSIRTR